MSRKRAAFILGLSAFSLGTSLGDDHWWTWFVIVGNLLLLQYAWSQLTAEEVDR